MRHSKKLAAFAIAAGVAITASAAFGWWSSSGTGEGSAFSGTDSAFVVTSAAPDGPALAPIDDTEDGPQQTIEFYVKNENAGHQMVQTVAVSVANDDGTAWDGPGDCSAADFSIEVDDDTPDADLAKDGVYTGEITIRMVNRDANQDACRSILDVPLFIDVN
jgi:hypothetical protein